MSIRQGNKIIAGTPDASSVKIDNITLTENQAGDTQAVALVDQNTGYVKTWTGTQAEYDAIEVKDLNTLYNVEDDDVAHDSSIGLDIGDIGFAPLGIDETQNKRRYLNGQVISQAQFVSFTAKVKNAILLYPSLSATEENWQAEVTNSKLGQCGKFVIDDTLGTIRLPKVVNIQGLTDLANIGTTREAGLPNIEASWARNTGNEGVVAAHSETILTGAFYKGEEVYSYSAGYSQRSGVPLNFDASRSNSIYGNSNTVQQEAVQYPYFIQVATGVEESIDVSREIQLNNPFFFGMSQYFESTPNNASWLLSNGAFHSGSVYVSFYQWLLRIYNGVDSVDGVSVKLHTEAYDDYDYVINTADTTFRLPLLNGSENIPDNNNVQTFSGFPYTADRNQVIFVNTRGETQSYLGLAINGVRVYLEEAESGVRQRINAQIFVNKGDIVSTSGIVVANDYLAFAPCVGNGSLYFYVGETIQDANLISIGKVTELLARLENYDYVVDSKVATSTDKTWYRVYKSGWIEQGGVTEIAGSTNPSSTPVYFAKEMADTNYTLTIGTNVGSSGWQYANGCTVEGKTTTGFNPRCATGSGTATVNWQLAGQGA